MFGSPETQPGGRALKFYSSQRIDIRRIETLKEKGSRRSATGCGQDRQEQGRGTVPPGRVRHRVRRRNIGRGCLLDFGVEHDIVQKSGAFFCYGATRLGQGRNNAEQFLVDNPAVAAEIEAKIRAELGIGAEAAPAPPVAEAQAA